MTATYYGDPLYPTGFPLADDSVPPTAVAFNPAVEALGDRTAYLKALADANKCVPVRILFLGNGSFMLPANAAPFAFWEGCGGGGAGGTGSDSGAVGVANAGGGGGGGALKNEGVCTLFPGEVHSVTIGAGGLSSVFGLGNSGAETVLMRASTGTPLATCRGAGGGQPGPTPTSNRCGFVADGENTYAFARGGGPVALEAGTFDLVCERSTNYPSLHHNKTPQAGGLGTCSFWRTPDPLASPGAQGTLGDPGNGSPQGTSGGVGGTPGLHSSGYFGGGAGGGGGAGAYGSGGKGGNGSNGVTSGASAAPQDGASAGANTGGGGGGGGGAGCAATTTTSGAAPGDGGSGQFTIIYFIPAVLP